MELTMVNRLFRGKARGRKVTMVDQPDLTHAQMDQTYLIRQIRTGDPETRDFLFSLGCFEGEKITVISRLADNYIIHVNNARYSIDGDLARAILI